jgi:HPt (histidine-containing phosphotransfer) domain-containing protein
MTDPADADDLLDPAALARLRRLTRGRPERLSALLAAFLGETPQLLVALRAALADGDAASLRAAAHSLRGTALYLGAARLADLCADLERLGGGRLAEAAPLVDAVEPLVGRLAEALRAECRRLEEASPG